MKIVLYDKLSKKEKEDLLKRPSIDMKGTYKIVQPILSEIKTQGLKSVIKYAEKYDGLKTKNIKVSLKEFKDIDKKVSDQFKTAVRIAAKNIKKFHLNQIGKEYTVETTHGIKCSRVFRPIQNVGLYIPGGTAILPSTLLMLGIPAKIAGCKRIVVCSPTKDKMNPEVLFVAKYLGIEEIYKVGGAQAIGLMAYGTREVPKVDKIFGPGNQYVTAAKALVSIDSDGCSIDMIAGPSEVLVIADNTANPDYIAADLLSQAEHGIDSQVIFCTTNKEYGENVICSVKNQIDFLERKNLAEKALENSYVIIFKNVENAIDFSNMYAPEHLILNFKYADKFKNKIVNAGSVFIGPYSPESVGDYASGTNHSLPTSGYAKSNGGVTVEQFMKSITFQKVSKKGLEKISKAVIDLAETENLGAHANAIKIRLKNGK